MKLKTIIAPVFIAVAFAGVAGGATADDKCSITIDSNDAMQFDKDVVVVDKSCEQFTVKLTHSGQLGENVMGHNWVLTAPDNVQAVAQDGMKAGLNNEYVKPSDERVLAYTDVIGGGEATSVTFDVNKLSVGGTYTYFCSFPGHYGVMRGTLSIK